MCCSSPTFWLVPFTWALQGWRRAWPMARVAQSKRTSSSHQTSDKSSGLSLRPQRWCRAWGLVLARFECFESSPLGAMDWQIHWRNHDFYHHKLPSFPRNVGNPLPKSTRSWPNHGRVPEIPCLTILKPFWMVTNPEISCRPSSQLDQVSHWILGTWHLKKKPTVRANGKWKAVFNCLPMGQWWAS